MVNPMMQGLMASRIAPIKNLFQMAKAAQNPQMAIQQVVLQNSQMKQVLDYVNQNGGNPQQAFYALAKEKGVDPESIINMLQ